MALARQAEESARGTIAKLADQSGKYHLVVETTVADGHRTDRQLGAIPRHGQGQQPACRRQDGRTQGAQQKHLPSRHRLEQGMHLSLSLSYCIYHLTDTTQDAKRQAQEDKINERHAMERMDRAKALLDVQDTRKRLGAAANPAPYGSSSSTTPEPVPGQQKARKDARSRYQFDATASDDELEDELDENLDETLEISRRLKGLATAMGDEVSGQNSRLTRVTDKTENLEFAVMKNTERLKRIR